MSSCSLTTSAATDTAVRPFAEDTGRAFTALACATTDDDEEGEEEEEDEEEEDDDDASVVVVVVVVGAGAVAVATTAMRVLCAVGQGGLRHKAGRVRSRNPDFSLRPVSPQAGWINWTQQEQRAGKAAPFSLWAPGQNEPQVRRTCCGQLSD